MTEAWHYEHRPLIYAVLRRLELTRYVFDKKNWHADAPWFTRLRAWWLVLCGHETEICCFCGGKVGLVWWCNDDELWAKLTGWTEGEGASCLECFDNRARDHGFLLYWHPRAEKRVAKKYDTNPLPEVPR